MKLTDLQEAKYAQKNPTAEEVYKLYKSVEKKYDYIWGEKDGSREDELGQPYSLSHALGIEAVIHDKYTGGKYAQIELMFHLDMPRDAGKKWSIQFARDNNLPYSNLAVDDEDNSVTWATLITYDPEHFNK